MNKQIIITSSVVAVIAAVIVSALFLRGASLPDSGNQGGSVSWLDATFANVTASGCVASNGITSCQKKLTVDARAGGLNYATWENKTSKTFYITDGSVFTAGTASSAVKMFLYATTGPSTIRAGEQYTNPTVAFNRRILS